MKIHIKNSITKSQGQSGTFAHSEQHFLHSPTDIPLGGKVYAAGRCAKGCAWRNSDQKWSIMVYSHVGNN